MFSTCSSMQQSESNYSNPSSLFLSLSQEIEKKSNFDGTLEKMKDEGNIQRCPWCGVYIQKNGGCNIIKCSSETCNNNNIFCYLCGDKLSKQNKLIHFINKDSNANSCVGLKYSQSAGKSSDSVMIDESNKNIDLKEFFFGDQDINKFLDVFGLKSCPRCYSKNNLVLEMNCPLYFKCSNFSCHLSFLACLICNKILKSEEILSHLKIEELNMQNLKKNPCSICNSTDPFKYRIFDKGGLKFSQCKSANECKFKIYCFQCKESFEEIYLKTHACKKNNCYDCFGKEICISNDDHPKSTYAYEKKIMSQNSYDSNERKSLNSGDS